MKSKVLMLMLRQQSRLDNDTGSIHSRASSFMSVEMVGISS